MGAAGLASIVASYNSCAPQDEPVQEKAPQPESPHMPKRRLGKTGVEVPLLSLGGTIDFVENQVALEKCFQSGVTYWDTAADYAGENSELGIGKFIARHPDARKKLFIATKASDAVTVEDVEKALRASLKRLNTDYIDLYHIMDRIAGPGYVGHGLSDPAKLTPDLNDWVKVAKKRKLIRFFGFSTHQNMAKCLTAAARLDWIDVVMTKYNFQLLSDRELQAAVDACHKAGIGLVAMKTQGLWPKSEQEKNAKLETHFLKQGFTPGQAKIKLVLEDQRFSSACVGMWDVKTISSNVDAVLDKKGLSEADRRVLRDYARSTGNGHCAGCAEICGSALPNMPYVCDIMRCLMYYNSYGQKDRARQLFARIPQNSRISLLTLDYSLAEARCPQHLPIRQLIAEAVAKLA